MSADLNNPVPAGFDSLPVLDLRDPNFTVLGNRLLAELRAKGPVCRVEPAAGPSSCAGPSAMRSSATSRPSRSSSSTPRPCPARGKR